MKSIPGCLVVPPTEETLAMMNHCEVEGLSANSIVPGSSFKYSAVLGGLGYTGISVPGDCGSLLMLQNKTIFGKIMALHRAGNNNTSVGAIVTQDILNNLHDIAMKPKGDRAIMEEACFVREHCELDIFPEAYIHVETQLVVIGQPLMRVFVPSASRVTRTGISIPQYDNHQPAILSAQDPRADGFKPMVEGMKRYGQRTVTTEPDEVQTNEAFENIGNEIANKILSAGKTVRILTKTEALNTPPELEYPRANPVDRSGSAGYPHCAVSKNKGDYLTYNERKGKWYFGADEKGKKMSSLISQVIQDAKVGKPNHFPFVAYLKDECVKIKKVTTNKKTRLFFSGPFEYLMAYRMYFNAAGLRCTEMYAELPPKIGISSSFEDWHCFTYSLLKVCDKGFASDVENFDSSVPLVFLKGVRKVYDAIYAKCGDGSYDVEEAKRVRDVLHEAIEGAEVIALGKLFKLTQAQVSGNPGTALENSWIIWALYYLVWKDLAQFHAPELKSYSEFRKRVSLGIYGDDNLCTVDPTCTWFNYNTFAKTAAKYGFSITDAAKKGGLVPDYLPLAEMSFLKRSFVNIQNYWCGPLELDSIAKCMTWIKGHTYRYNSEVGFPISSNKALVETSINAMWPELALHGKEKYEEWISVIMPQTHALGLRLLPPTWSQAMLVRGYNVVDTNL